MIILLAISFLIIVIFWIFDEDYGITVQPFEIVGLGENTDGKSFATLLRFDLQRIKNIYSGQDIPVISKSNSENKIIPRPFGEFLIPPLSNFKDIPLEYSISQIGTVGVEGTSISIGNMVLSIREFLAVRTNTVTCSLQRYNSTIIIVALLEDQNDTNGDIMTFEVKNNTSNAEQIPNLINDLAFQISLALSKRGMQPKEDDLYPQNWQTFKYLTQGRDAYNSYIITKDVNDLDRVKHMALLARNFEPSYKKTLDLLSALGFAYLQSGEYDEAANIFRNITGFNPFESALGLGVIYYHQGNYTEALNAFKKATQLNSQDASAWNNEGITLYKLGRYNEAVDAFNNAIVQSNVATAWYNKGIVLTDLGEIENNRSRYEEAIEAYSRAIDNKSQNSELNAKAWTGKCTVFNAKGEYNNSIQACNKAIEIDPQHSTAWLNKGDVLDKQGKYEEAIQAFNESIRLDPNFAKAWLKKGVFLYSHGKYDEAGEVLDEAIKLDPNQTSAWIAKGVILTYQGKYDEAVKASDEAIRLDPNDATARYLKNVSLDALGKTTESNATLNPRYRG
jgi:tetratricopeptide (TPR) repeat protein